MFPLRKLLWSVRWRSERNKKKSNSCANVVGRIRIVIYNGGNINSKTLIKLTHEEVNSVHWSRLRVADHSARPSEYDRYECGVDGVRSCEWKGPWTPRCNSNTLHKWTLRYYFHSRSDCGLDSDLENDKTNDERTAMLIPCWWWYSCHHHERDTVIHYLPKLIHMRTLTLSFGPTHVDPKKQTFLLPPSNFNP